MNISEIMTTDVQIVSPEDDIRTAAQLMSENDFGSIPVGENNRLIGMLSDRDITTRAVAKGLDPSRCKVREIMSPDIRYVFDDNSIEEAAQSMSDLQIRRLPVLSRDKRLVGIVSLGDIAQNDTDPAGDALSAIST